MTEYAASGFKDLPTDAVKVLQFSDMHLFAEPDKTLLGLDTQQSFLEVLRKAQATHWPADLILITGDLAQDGSREAYQRLQQRFAALSTPTYRLPGNHDDPVAMDEILNGKNVHAARTVYPGNWQIILLNSAVPDHVEGYLDEAELAALDRHLTEHPDRHALICLHHTPVPVGSRWIDELGLTNAADFFAVLNRHAQVRAILWGHIHQEFDAERNSVRLLSTPSTCFQFRPGADDFTLDVRPPGYRWLVLHADGLITTGVCRLDYSMLGIAMDSTGY